MTVLLIVLVCLGTGMAIRLLRRLPRLVFISSLIGAGLLAYLLATASSEPTFFFGRVLTLDTAARVFLWNSVIIAATLAFFGPLTFERGSNLPTVLIANSQGAYFFWSLAPLVVAIALDSFPIAVFFWAIGLVVLMLTAHPQREGHVGGAAQFLLLVVIAGACLLLANRLIDLYPLTPENLDLIQNAVVLFVLGFGLLLAAVPLNIWLGPLADEMPLAGMAFLVGVAQPIGVWLLMQQLSTVNWLTDKSPLLSVLVLGGVVSTAIGAVLTIAENRHGRFLAYLSLLPLGSALVGLGLGTRLALVGATLALFNRAIGITLAAGGLSFMQHHAERRWQWFGGLALLLGGFSVTGIPAMLGFAARYPIYTELAKSNVAFVALLLVSNAIALLATIRMAWRGFAVDAQADGFSGEFKIVPYLCALVVILLLAATVVMGLFPQWIGDLLLETLGKAAYLK